MNSNRTGMKKNTIFDETNIFNDYTLPEDHRFIMSIWGDSKDFLSLWLKPELSGGLHLNKVEMLESSI